MKLSKLKIFLILSILTILIVVVGMGFVVRSKFNEKELRTLAIAKIQSAFPKAKVELGKMQMKFWASLYLNVDKVYLGLPRGKKTVNLLEIEDLTVKVPIWSILWGGGNIEVALERPQVTYLQIGAKSNWQLAMDDSKASPRKGKSIKVTDTTGDEDKGLMLPAFVLKSSIGIKLNQALLDYQLDKDSKGKVAFTMSLDAKLPLKEFLANKELSSKLDILLSRISLSNLPYKIPDLKNRVDFKLSKKSGIKGKFDGRFANSSFNFDFKVKDGDITITKIKAALRLKDMLDISNQEDIPIAAIANKSSLGIKAALAVKKAKFEFWIKTALPILNGRVNTATRGEIVLNSHKPFHNRMKYEMAINAKNLQMSEEFLKRSIAKKGKTQNVKSAKEASLERPLLPGGKITWKFKNIKIGDSSVNTNGKAFTGGKNAKGNFSLQMDKFNLAVLNNFAPSGTPAIEGKVSGKMEGRADISEVIKHKVKVSLAADQGKLKGIDVNSYLQKVWRVAGKIPQLKGRIDPNRKMLVDGSFDKFELEGNFAQDHYQLSKFYFLGMKKNIEVKAHGSVYPNPLGKEGKIFAEVKEFKVLDSLLKKHTDVTAFPVLFKGRGFDLRPDYGYSIKKLSKGKLKEQKQKLRQKGRDKLKNLLKGKGKDLLKKLF